MCYGFQTDVEYGKIIPTEESCSYWPLWVSKPRKMTHDVILFKLENQYCQRLK